MNKYVPTRIEVTVPSAVIVVNEKIALQAQHDAGELVALLNDGPITSIAQSNAMSPITTRLAKTIKAIETAGLDARRPFKQVQDKIMAAERTVIDPLKVTLAQGQLVLATYQKQQREKAEAAKREQERITREAIEAERKGGPVDSFETAAAMAQPPVMPVYEVPTGTGVTFRNHYRLEILNEEEIPREYLEPNKAKILTVLKAGIKVAGCALITDQIPVGTRR